MDLDEFIPGRHEEKVVLGGLLSIALRRLFLLSPALVGGFAAVPVIKMVGEALSDYPIVSKAIGILVGIGCAWLAFHVAEVAIALAVIGILSEIYRAVFHFRGVHEDALREVRNRQAREVYTST